MEIYSSSYRHAFVVATVIILGYALLKLLAPFVAALEWTVVLGFLLYPLQVRLSRALHHRHSLAAGIITVLTPFVIIAPLSLLTGAFAQQVAVLVKWLKSHSLLSVTAITQDLAQYPLLGRLLAWSQEHLPVGAEDLDKWATEGANKLLQEAASASGTVVVGVAGTLVQFGLMLFLLYYFLRDGRAMLAHVIRLIPMEAKRREQMIRDLIAVLRAVVYGTAMTAALEGILIGIAWAIIELPSPVVFGALTALAAFVPAVGMAIVVTPAILYLAAVGRWGAAIFFLVWSLLVSLSENFVRPLLTSRHGEISPLAVFVGAIGGVATFGLIGLVLGPVLLNLIVALIRLAGERVSQEARATEKGGGT